MIPDVKKEKQRILIFDTTLRDGEQSPGATMTEDEKVLIARALDDLKVDTIEAGFAAASAGDFQSIEKISKNVHNVRVCSLARATEKDILAAAEAIKHAKKSRIHTFISTSAIHMEYKLKMSAEKVLNLVKESVSFARNLNEEVEWSAEDATRTDFDFLCRCVEAAICNGATIINLPDTVGYSTPFEYKRLFEKILQAVPNSDKAIFSTHCHDDLGLSVANSLSGILGGARQIECTINGLGERAGNAALEEIVMALQVRSDIYPFTTAIETGHLSRISKLVSNFSGFVVQKNKAIVGENAFAHESGIHQDGMLKSALTYEIMSPQSIGLKQSMIVLGKHSGRAALKNKCQELKLSLEEDAFEALFKNFKLLADQKKEVLDSDILSLINSQELSQQNIQFLFYSIATDAKEKGSHHLQVHVQEGKEKKMLSYTSVGVINGLFQALNQLIPQAIILERYDVQAVTHNTDALAHVKVSVRHQDHLYSGYGTDFDTVAASAKSYICAINKIIHENFAKEEK